MKEIIRQRAFDLGFDDCRFTAATTPDHAAEFQRWLAKNRHGEMGYLERNAQKRIDPQKVLPGARSVITLATSYAASDEGPVTRGEGRASGACHPSPVTRHHSGLVARYARFKDYHDVIGGRLRVLGGFVDQLAGDGARALWYVDTGPLLERDLAQRAGLGFIGKHASLISRKFGNWIFLSEILTTLELEPDAPERNHCGSCARCIAACPTQAIRSPFQLDARLCISYLTIELKGAIPVGLRPAIGNRIYGCDDCLAACPWNRFAREGNLMKSHARPDLAEPDLLELLSLDDASFKSRFGGTPVLRTKRRGLLRNVSVALGNVGGESALPSLRKAAADSEPLIAEHACWAIDQIQKRAARKGANAAGLPG